MHDITSSRRHVARTRPPSGARPRTSGREILGLALASTGRVVLVLLVGLGSVATRPASSENAAHTLETEGSIVIGNDRVEAVFSKPLFYTPLSVRDKAHEFDLIGDREAILTLWWIQVLSHGEYVDLFAVVTDAAHTSHELEQLPEGARVVLHWDDTFDGTSWLDLDVTVEVVVGDGQGFLEWSIDIDNNEDVTIVKTYFPLVAGITTLGPSGDDDRLLYPHGEGYLVEDPLTALGAGYGWAGFESYGGGDWRLSSDYPGIVSLQLVSLYEEGRGGFYLTTMDAESHSKGYLLQRLESSMVLSVLMHPDRYRRGASWQQPYPLRIGVFDGDWQDIALIYREWAELQSWTSRGRLSQREDVPRWWTESGLTLHLEGYDDVGDPGISLEEGKTAIRLLDERLDCPITVRWRGGFHVIDPEETEDITSFAHDHDASVVYHTNARLYMLDDDPTYVAASTIDPWGEHFTEANPYWFGYIMCPAHETWQRHLRGLWTAILDHGCDGVYVDQVAATPWVPCSSTSHGHEPGETGPWWVAQEYEIPGPLLGERTTSGDTVHWSTEMQNEVYLPLYHTSLAWQVGAETLFGMRFQSHARFVPLFSFVYHEYTSAFGADSPLTDWTVPSEVLTYNLGYDFITGKCPGAFHNPAGNFDVANMHPPTFAYLKSLAELRAGELNPFLVFGRMLVNPEVEVDRVSVPFENLLGQSYTIHNTTRILYSTWKVHEGGAAVILTNWQGQPNRVVVTVSPDDLKVAGGVELVLVGGEASSVLAPSWSGSIMVALELEPYATRAIVADPGRRRAPPRRPLARLAPGGDPP